MKNNVLKVSTPISWARQALTDPRALLNDHAHLERKAATNALDILPRWPEGSAPSKWIKLMTAIARDEIQHFGVVVKLLEKRGGKLTKHHSNLYTQALREKVRLGQGKKELVDRLLISALIELRSAERFSLLQQAAEDDPELHKLYRNLWASEHGHYRIFVSLTEQVLPAAEAAHRWQEMLDYEAAIISKSEPGPRMHSGW